MTKQYLEQIAEYSDQYVAITKDNEIVAADISIKNLENKLKNIADKEITIRYITPIDKFISP